MMKMKSRNLTFMLYLSAVFSMLFMLVSNSANAGTISGSAHDLRAYTGASGEICVTCHTPHGGDTSTTVAPLWNHEVTQATYTLYGEGGSAPTLNATVSQPTGISKLCLSCHDGSVAIDSFGGTTGTEFMPVTATNNKAVAGDAEGLSNDHPISFTYDSALVTADGALNPTSTPIRIGDATGTGDYRDTTIAGGMLFNNRVECASCHDVHNKFTASNQLLKISRAGSALCLTCHDK